MAFLPLDQPRQPFNSHTVLVKHSDHDFSGLPLNSGTAPTLTNSSSSIFRPFINYLAKDLPFNPAIDRSFSRCLYMSHLPYLE